jgi:hypothetical protein
MRTLLATIAILGATIGTATAGYTLSSNVYVYNYNYGEYVYASGQLKGARNSSDSVQNVSCGVSAWTSGTTVTRYGSCQAQDSAGTYATCVTYDANYISLMQSANGASWISFTGQNGWCTYVGIGTGSSNL